MQGLMKYKIAFTYNDNVEDERSSHAIYFDNNVLFINLNVYNEASRHDVLSSIRFNIFFHLIEDHQVNNNDSFAKKQNPKGIEIEDDYLRGEDFKRDDLRNEDSPRLEKLLTRVVSEWTAYILSFDKNLRDQGIRLWLEHAPGRAFQKYLLKMQF
jgi:hypothetical protein